LPIVGAVRQTIDVSSAIWRQITVGAGSVWATNGVSGQVERIDLNTGEVIETITAGLPGDSQMTGRPNVWGIAFGHGAVWVSASREQAIVRIDPATNEVTDTIYVDGHVAALAVTEDAIWAATMGEATVLRIDPETFATIATIGVAADIWSLHAADSELWGTTWNGHLVRIDPETNTGQSTAIIREGSGCACWVQLAPAPSGVWVVNLNTLVNRFDPSTGLPVARLETSNGEPVEVASIGDAIWLVVIDGEAAHLERLDPETNRIIASGPTFDFTLESTGGSPDGSSRHYLDLATDGNTLWIVTSQSTIVGIDLGS
jgi:streptogramin lyase